jgi:hypothetical protein
VRLISSENYELGRQHLANKEPCGESPKKIVLLCSRVFMYILPCTGLGESHLRPRAATQMQGFLIQIGVWFCSRTMYMERTFDQGRSRAKFRSGWCTSTFNELLSNCLTDMVSTSRIMPPGKSIDQVVRLYTEHCNPRFCDHFRPHRCPCFEELGGQEKKINQSLCIGPWHYILMTPRPT